VDRCFSALWLWFYGRVAGISGLLGGIHFTVDLQVGWPSMILAELLAGYSTRMGHGVCGIARLSPPYPAGSGPCSHSCWRWIAGMWLAGRSRS